MKKITLILSTLFFTFLVAANSQNFINHKVQPGESVSLICIDIYGYYGTKMGEKIKEINPKISNINRIAVGMNIKLPFPQKTVADKKMELFNKQVDIKQGVVTAVVPDAFIIRDGKQSALVVNRVIKPGDTLVTGENGRVEIIINRESVTRMSSNTRLTIGQYRDKTKKKRPTILALTNGKTWTKVKKFRDKISRFQLTLPTIIAGVHGTVYESSINSDSTSEVKVFSGAVSVENRPSEKSGVQEVSGPTEIAGPTEVSMEHWFQLVTTMQKISVSKDGLTSKVSDFKIEKPDSWEEWNLKRDKRISEMFGSK